MTYIVKKEIRGSKYYYEYESYRVGGKVKHRCVRYLGKSGDIGKKKVQSPLIDLTVNNSLDYGSVVALYTLAERLRLPEIIYQATAKGGGQHIGKLVELMVINRCIEPLSRNRLKGWYEKTALPILLGIPPEKVHPQIFYNAMNHLTDRAILEIQKELYRQVKRIYGVDTSRIFYDLTSTYFEGTKCPLARFGHSTNHRPDKLQINIGIGVDKNCIPITHEVFTGSVRDVTTVQGFAQKLKSEFGLESPIVVIDRGMISRDNLDRLLELHYHYIAARKMGSPESKLVQEISGGEFTEATLTDYSEKRAVFLAERTVRGRRWIVGWNREKAADDRAFRDLMIARSIQKLERVKKDCGKRNLKLKEQVYHKVHTILDKFGTERFFEMGLNQRGAPRPKFELRDREIEKACKLDGKYILETSNFELTSIEIAQAYLDRDVVEKFFQALKDVVELRPTYVYTERHVKAHVFICTLAVLLLSLLRKILKEEGKDLTSMKALEILDGIKRVEFSLKEGKGMIVRTTKFTDQQRELISIINVPPIAL
jgi:transposase